MAADEIYYNSRDKDVQWWYDQNNDNVSTQKEHKNESIAEIVRQVSIDWV